MYEPCMAKLYFSRGRKKILSVFVGFRNFIVNKLEIFFIKNLFFCGKYVFWGGIYFLWETYFSYTCGKVSTSSTVFSGKNVIFPTVGEVKLVGKVFIFPTVVLPRVAWSWQEIALCGIVALWSTLHFVVKSLPFSDFIAQPRATELVRTSGLV